MQSSSFISDIKSKIREASERISHFFWPLKKEVLLMLLTGFFDGFLGGLVAVRSPPLIIFFLLFNYSSPVMKANGTVISTVNTYIRLISYIFKTPPDTYGTKSWFVREDLSMYLAVCLAGILASKLGSHASPYLNNRWYKVALTILLIINGITMIVTASIDIADDIVADASNDIMELHPTVLNSS